LLAAVAIAPGASIAATLSDIVADEGPAAARGAIDAARAAGSRKKVAAALAALDAGSLRLPVRLALGAELQVTRGALADCTLGDTLSCDVVLTTVVPASSADFELQCGTSWGATRPLTAVAGASEPDRAVLRITDLRDCLDFGDHLRVVPVALLDLDGVGQGDEFHPPELIGLTWDQVRQTLDEQLPSLQYCPRKLGLPANGALVVAFHIGADGTLEQVRAESSTLDEPRVLECVLERFRRVRFPPPNDGFTDGSYPLRFQSG
jgi:hypothetical protein